MDLLIKACKRLDTGTLSISETHWIYEDDNNIDIGKYLIVILAEEMESEES